VALFDFKEGSPMRKQVLFLQVCVVAALLLVAAIGGGWKWDLALH
jgi:hypothetical protein